MRGLGAALLLLAPLASAAPARAQEDAKLLRFPDIHDDFVVFVYAGDLWRAPVAGGPAWRLTSHPGQELFPQISPDGKSIAFSAEYSGSRQVYVMPSWGGTPRQLTYYTDVGPMPPRGGWDDWVQGWTGDGKILVRMNRTPWGQRMGRYYLVDPAGGLETPLLFAHGGSASYSPDGKKFAWTPVDREFRTWKRTRGGRAQDIWIHDFAAGRSERLTEDPGTDNFPMWAGETIYFTSDREGSLNLYAHDLRTRAVRRLTDFRGTDVLWPSLGKEAIVFMNEGALWRFDLASARAERLPIQVGTDGPGAVPYFKNVRGNVSAFDLSPAGSRALLEARGELFTVPAEHGAVRNLTETQGVREHSPAWSPDGRSLAYLSDATGEYEIYVRPADASSPPRQLTRGGTCWKYPPRWSPDGKKLAYADRTQRLYIVDASGGSPVEVDHSAYEDLTTYTWSPDSRYLAYEKSHDSRLTGIFVHDVAAKRSTALGDGMTQDTDPDFSGDGKYLFFLSNRDFRPVFSAFEFNYLYRNATRVFVATLAPEVPSLFPVRDDDDPRRAEDAGKSPEDEFEPRESRPKKEPPAEEPPKKEGNGKDAVASKPKPAPVTLQPQGFAARTLALPDIRPGNYVGGLAVNTEAVFYVRQQDGEGGAGDGNAGGTLYRYDLKQRKEEKVQDSVTGWTLSGDGKKLLYRTGDTFAIVDAKANAKAEDGKLDLGDLRVKIDPRAEWRQMFDDAWRITRDWFYDPAMHGVDWDFMRTRYAALLPHLAHRADLDFVLGEMLSELQAGHTYVASGDEPRVERVRGGMLGAELAPDPSGRYRIARIFPGENWDDTTRSPLTEPGIEVKEGEFLLAIDGVDLTTKDNPYRLLEGKADRPVVLTIHGKPDGKGARKVTVRPVGSELGLRYLDWVRSRMALVDRLSGGKIGYIHLPDTSFDGNRMLQKLFYGQARKAALVVDDRYNGGGFIPDRMIEMLGRDTLAWWKRRGIAAMRTPGFAHDGPMAMLVNAYSASGGDALPYFFRQKGLGRIFGTRTWGGLIGLSGNPPLADGGSVQVPAFRIYDERGSFVVENEGVSPDEEVFDLPEALAKGGDPTLERAVSWLLAQLPAAVAEPPEPKAKDLTP